MKVLVTGGTGFVGTCFFEQLSKQGVDAVRFDLHPPKDGSAFTKGDVRDREALDAAMKDVSGVIHLAAAHHDFGISKQTFHDVNVTGMQNVCDSMQKFGVRKLCFFSTVAVYGSQSLPNENSVPTPESEYGKTKLAAEAVCRDWCQQETENQCLTLRPTVIFGENNFANMFFLIRQIESGKFLRVGEMDNIKSLAHVSNIVRTTLDLWLEQGDKRSGFEFFNYVDTPDLTSWEIAEHIYEGIGKQPSSLRIPFSLARILAIPFDLVIGMTGRNLPISTARLKKLSKSVTQFDASKVHDVTSAERQPLGQCIEEMARWYVETGKGEKAVDRRPPESNSR